MPQISVDTGGDRGCRASRRRGCSISKLEEGHRHQGDDGRLRPHDPACRQQQVRHPGVRAGGRFRARGVSGHRRPAPKATWRRRSRKRASRSWWRAMSRGGDRCLDDFIHGHWVASADAARGRRRGRRGPPGRAHASDPDRIRLRRRAAVRHHRGRAPRSPRPNGWRRSARCSVTGFRPAASRSGSACRRCRMRSHSPARRSPSA